MSKARAQSKKRKSMRSLYGTQNMGPKSSKRPGMRLQVIELKPPKKRGRISKHQKWIEKLPFHLGISKFIYHEPVKFKL